MKENIIKYFESKEFKKVHKKLIPYPKYRYLIAIFFLFIFPLQILSIFLIISGFKKSKALKKERNLISEDIKRSKLVKTYPVMVNPEFLKGTQSTGPGLVLMSFEDQEASSTTIAQYIENLKNPLRLNLDKDDLKTVLNIKQNLEASIHRRRTLPKALTGGRLYYICDILFIKNFLHNTGPLEICEQNSQGKLDTTMVYCMARKGIEKKMHLIPDELIKDFLPENKFDNTLNNSENKIIVKSIDQLLKMKFDHVSYCYGVCYNTDLRFRNGDAVQMLAHDIAQMNSHIPPNGISTYFDHICALEVIKQGLKTLKTLGSPNHTVLRAALYKVKIDDNDFIDTEGYNDSEDWDQWDYDDENRFREFLEENREKFK